MNTNLNNQFNIQQSIKTIILFSLKEWSFYLILLVPYLQTKMIDYSKTKNAIPFLLVTVLFGLIGTNYIILLYKLSKKTLNHTMSFSGFFFQIIKHTIKIFFIYIFLLTLILIPYSMIIGDVKDQKNILIEHFPVILYCLLQFFSNYGITSIIITKTSHNSIRIIYKLFFTKYTLQNLIIIALIVFIGMTSNYILENISNRTIVTYSLSVLIYLLIPLSIIYLSIYAVYLNLLNVEKSNV